MSDFRSHARSFTGGEVTEEFYGQLTDVKFQTGLALCRNMIVKPHGPVSNRPGTYFVKAAKFADKEAHILPFTFSTTQTMALEFGDQYIRFHTGGGTLSAGTPTAWNSGTAYTLGNLASSAGVNYYCILAHTNQAPPNATYWYAMPTDGSYEIQSPYLEADVFALNFEQDQDVITISNVNYDTRELRRYGATDWRLVQSVFASELSAPGSPAATPTGGGANNFSYKITAIGVDGIQESATSDAAACTNGSLSTTVYNDITYAAVTGALRYNVYKQQNGLYGYIGQTDALTFRDDNIDADISKTPPIPSDPFDGADNKPGAVTYFEQRKWFAGSTNKQLNFWATRPGSENDLSYALPFRDDDAIQQRIRAREASIIRHLVPLSSLIVLTASGEFRITSVNTDAITPKSISIRPQSYNGASTVRPTVVNNSVIYAAARGGALRELGYSSDADAYTTSNLSIRAPHLFDDYQIRSLTFARTPEPVVWATSTSKNLIGLTYMPDQEVRGLHRHDTYTLAGQSEIESACAITEGEYDVIYMVVKRVIDGATVRYIEYMPARRFATLADSYFVDCGLTYSGSPISTITSGLEHLEGETVSILADGAVLPQQTVTSGGLPTPFDAPASKIHVGLPITADIQMLPMVVEMRGVGAFGQGAVKNINRVFLRVFESSGVYAGPDFDNLAPYAPRTDEPYGAPPRTLSEEIEIPTVGLWQEDGALCVRQSDPLPLTIASMTIEASIGS
jgi:hypothetical protein